MEYWEFLLQQEGDQSWLPLDTAQVEILEGRYRIMAHGSQANASVAVHISQTLGDRPPAKRRHLSREGQTNGEGLMVVLPFTRLAAGTWDICCSGQTPDPHPVDWSYAIQLRVLPQGSGEDGDWFADEGNLTTVSDRGSASPLSGDQVTEPSLDVTQVRKAIERFQDQLMTNPPVDAWGYTLALGQTALVGQAGQVIPLVGQVNGEGSVPPRALVVRLINPETATPVGLTPFEWTSTEFPAPLNLAVTIPSAPSTRLLLGELILVGEAEQELVVLALQRFTVTVDLSSLFDEIANQGETHPDLDLTFNPEAEEPRVDEDDHAPPERSINLPAAPPRVIPSLTLPRPRSTLPPKIYYPSSDEAQVHRPSLPPLATDSGRLDRNPSANPNPPDQQGYSPADPAPALNLPPLPPAPVPSPVDSHRFSAPSLAGVRPTGAGQAPQLPSHDAMGFRNLRLEERFWNRLNDLAITLQQEAIAQRAQAVAPDPTPPAPGEPVPPLPFAGEVVIYEDDGDQLDTPTHPSPEVPEVEAMVPPLPQLELPPGDWVAGQTALVRLRVPFHPNRLAIKVWLSDPQTHQLVEDPLQLTQLSPNGQGELEGSLQLPVPHGYLEVDLEAITIDLQTQRESYKVSQRQSIRPMSLGEIDPWSADNWGETRPSQP